MEFAPKQVDRTQYPACTSSEVVPTIQEGTVQEPQMEMNLAEADWGRTGYSYACREGAIGSLDWFVFVFWKEVMVEQSLVLMGW